MNIPFNRPLVTGREGKYLQEVMANQKLSGDGPFNNKCAAWLEERFGCSKALMTPSCTHALEMAAILAEIKPGDEVIMPSYTFVSTANAFALRGAKIVFIDIKPNTMNMDETLITVAITEKTKAIVPVHYAGVACEMDKIMEISKKHNLLVIEDAAQGVMSKYKNKYLGTIGHMGCYSFHETKNYTCGEGGALIINDERFAERAEIIREKGTNRSKFFRGQINKYTWVDIGSSYLPSELNAAYLYAQLEIADEVNRDRLNTWNRYYDKLRSLSENGFIDLPHIIDYCEHNGHMFFIKAKNLEERSRLIQHLQDNGINSVFHYIPLHSSVAGKSFGLFYGSDNYTTNESERLLRMPIYYGMKKDDVDKVCNAVINFYN
ncbi:MAG: dTDP-4-amino-4,6-dideoxygalactose transaminase [Syntrophomonas sp.]